MEELNVQSYCHGVWIDPGSGSRSIHSPIDGKLIGHCGGAELDFAGMADFARSKGGAALRDMTFMNAPTG